MPKYNTDLHQKNAQFPVCKQCNYQHPVNTNIKLYFNAHIVHTQNTTTITSLVINIRIAQNGGGGKTLVNLAKTSFANLLPSQNPDPFN